MANSSDYSALSKLLHHIVLSLPVIAKSSLDIDTSLRKAKMPDDFRQHNHVFVSGLARAGTTILTKTLYQTGLFRSLNYRDMPFVMMPILWKKISQQHQHQGELKERAHKDGIKVDFDSPEALEDIFWRVFTKNKYIFADHMAPYNVDEEIIESFVAYVYNLCFSSGHDLYLSKNNNNLLRLTSIRKAFPNASILIPFRNPLQHALSLMKQHEQFVSRHQKDRFSLSYMDWLGHHEFGLHHKPIYYPNCHQHQYKEDSMEYWLIQWINHYQWALDNAPDGCIYVSYDTLCENPDHMLGVLYQLINIPEAKITHNLKQTSKHTIDIEVEPAMMQKVNAVYDALNHKSLLSYS